MDAALSVFLEHGYTGATMQKIAAAAGVVVETIYRTFDGKAGLFKAAVDAAVAGGTERAERPVEQRPALRAVIEEPDRCAASWSATRRRNRKSTSASRRSIRR